MKNLCLAASLIIGFLFISCSNSSIDYSDDIAITDTDTNSSVTIGANGEISLNIRPRSVIKTGLPNYRLFSVYREKYNQKRKRKYIAGDYMHTKYNRDHDHYGNTWHDHFMPGLEALYGFNLVNISHYNIALKKRSLFFDKNVVVNTLYYPSFEKDTLNFNPVQRNYFLVSVYDMDTNNDSIINHKDLRHFYAFDQKGKISDTLVPLNYSVMSSEYDAMNDHMYIHAKLDENGNGKRDEGEPIHIFQIDLENPMKGQRAF